MAKSIKLMCLLGVNVICIINLISGTPVKGYAVSLDLRRVDCSQQYYTSRFAAKTIHVLEIDFPLVPLRYHCTKRLTGQITSHCGVLDAYSGG